MIRVPYTYNKKLLLNDRSKKESQVKIHSEWDGTRPTVNNLPFKRHLNKLELQLQQKQNRNYSHSNQIHYIEKLLEKITDGKKRINALVLCPYLVNVQKLTLEESQKILSEYFDGAIPKGIISYQLKTSYKKGYLPYSERHETKRFTTVPNTSRFRGAFLNHWITITSKFDGTCYVCGCIINKVRESFGKSKQGQSTIQSVLADRNKMIQG